MAKDATTGIVQDLLTLAMPERSAEVAKLTTVIEYQEKRDRPGFHLEAAAFDGHGLVVYTARSRMQAEAIGRIAWKSLRQEAGVIIGLRLQGRPYDLESPDLINAGAHERKRVCELVEWLVEFRNRDEQVRVDETHFARESQAFQEEEQVENQAAEDISKLAWSFVLLHESQHCLKRIAHHSYGGVTEEEQCDRYAVEMLMGRSAEYSAHMNYDRHQSSLVAHKRAMGIFAGLTIILESTEVGLRTPTESHPAWVSRARAVVRFLCPFLDNDDGHFWVFAASILRARLSRDGTQIGVLQFESVKGLFTQLLDIYERS
jgi:hypothetical protein